MIRVYVKNIIIIIIIIILCKQRRTQKKQKTLVLLQQNKTGADGQAMARCWRISTKPKPKPSPVWPPLFYGNKP
jgi:ABC-type cobalt transport system substrate-binding protein